LKAGIWRLEADIGEVAERLMAQPWKGCVRLVRTEGSNPSLSVFYFLSKYIPLNYAQAMPMPALIFLFCIEFSHKATPFICRFSCLEDPLRVSYGHFYSKNEGR
jgi:hypothetical protein